MHVANRGAWFEPPDYAPAARVAEESLSAFPLPPPIGSCRLPKLSLFVGEVETRGHHSDYSRSPGPAFERVLVAINVEGLADRVSGSSVSALPQPVTQNDDAFVLFLLGRGKGLAEHGLDTQHRE